MRRWRRSFMVVGLVALFAVVWLVLVAKNYSAPIDSYRVVDDRTIVVQVTGGHLSWCQLTSTVETAADIRVSAECLDWLPGPGTALGVFYELTVRLSQPLNNRVLKDGEGIPVALEKCSNNTCTPSQPP